MWRKPTWVVATLATAVSALLVVRAVSVSPAQSGPRPGAEGAAEPKVAASRLAHVTVYHGNALVTREVDVPPGAGLTELVVTALPPQTVNSSLYAEGTDGIRVLTTRFRVRPIFEDTREEVRKLDAQLFELKRDAE